MKTLKSRLSLVALMAFSAITALVPSQSVPAQAASRAEDAPVAQAKAPPNILFILTDDLDLEEIAYMPTLKSLLIDQGTSFSNYFVSVSLCCPSRSTTIRGQYSHNTGVETNGGGNGGFETAHRLGIESSTIATWLQGAGYRTGLFGKYLNGYPNTAGNTYIPPGWTEWSSAVKGNPYSEYNYTLNTDGTLITYTHKPKDYGTTVYTGEVKGFIQQSVQEKKPFFAYMAVYAPHQPATPAPGDDNKFPDAKAPRTPNYNEADVSDKPAYIRDLPLMKPAVQQRVDTLYRKRIQSLQAVDRAIETLYNTLKSDGQLDNTYIIFTSDNGFHLGNHRMPAGKQTAYEEDIHLPFVVRGPGVAAGKIALQMAGNIDLAPTMAAMAGVTPPDFVDGRSLLPVLLGHGPSTWRSAYLVEHFNPAPAPATQAGPNPETQEPNDPDQLPEGQYGDSIQATATPVPSNLPTRVHQIPDFHGIRGNGYVYVEYATGEKEFYNLTNDRYELHNLASKLDPATRKALSDRLTLLVDCKADRCRAAEDQPLSFSMPVAP